MICAVSDFNDGDRGAGGRAEGPTISEKKLEILKYTVKKVGDF